MQKEKLSLILLIVMLFLVVSPTIFVVVDDIADVSIVLSGSEEGEKGNEKKLDIEILLPMYKIEGTDLFFKSSDISLGYLDKKYSKPYINIISPPPDFPFYL